MNIKMHLRAVSEITPCLPHTALLLLSLICNKSCMYSTFNPINPMRCMKKLLLC